MIQLAPGQVREALRLAERIQRGLRDRPLARRNVQRSGVGQHLKLAETRVLQVLRTRGHPPAGSKNIATEFGLVLSRLWADFPDLAFSLYRADLLPKTKIPGEALPGIFSEFRNLEIVSEDGEIWGTGKYEQLDPGWALSLLNYLATLIFGKSHFRRTPAHIMATGKDRVTVALFGDWGTGVWDDEGCICPAAKISLKLQALNRGKRE